MFEIASCHNDKILQQHILLAGATRKIFFYQGKKYDSFLVVMLLIEVAMNVDVKLK